MKKKQYLIRFRKALSELDSKCQEYKKEILLTTFKISSESSEFLTDTQTQFVILYQEYHNPFTVGQLLGLSREDTISIWSNFYVQKELESLNNILFHKLLVAKLDSIDELGGYLTSLLIDENIPECNKLSTESKLTICEEIIDLNKFKALLFTDATQFIYKKLPQGKLSRAKIRDFLYSKTNVSEQQRKTAQLPHFVSMAERNYLDTLPQEIRDPIVDDILEKINKKN